jgi:hypothetical protein
MEKATCKVHSRVHAEAGEERVLVQPAARARRRVRAAAGTLTYT